VLPTDPLFKDKEKLLQHSYDTVINSLSYGPSMLAAQRKAAVDTSGNAAATNGLDVGADSNSSSSNSKKTK
jgi:hypothetical protein